MAVDLQETLNSEQAALANRTVKVEHIQRLIAKLRRMKVGRDSEGLEWQINTRVAAA
ncbi:hypothetical protein [Caballeronia sordidicola]|uniref:Uncharacterized protein n=1 Tax=Caballeronia sordidicola TaxID=196367 RepID=A0A226X9Z4_CABSO|nr:hypothetical protein [Caballeronia sordidicola]OXC79767.1 hypothetical protein BSU04_05035 [Caballeronia sordidicola]